MAENLTEEQQKQKGRTICEMTQNDIEALSDLKISVVLEAHSPEDTFLLGRKLGEASRPGMVVALDGDLGTGKTVFAKGFAAGLGVKETVSSPTFTILQVYEEGRLPLYHFDVYRIEDIEEMEEIGYEDCFYGSGVCLIEWADLICDILPKRCLRIVLEKEPDRGFDYRRIRVCSYS